MTHALDQRRDRDENPGELPARLTFRDGKMWKPNGKEIILNGVAFGSWNEDSPDDAAPVKALGAKCVRVNLKWWRPGDADSRDDLGFAFLLKKNIEQWLAMIDAVIAQGLWVIPCVDSDCGQNGLQDAETIAYCDPRGTWPLGHNFFEDASMRRTYAQIVWPALATLLRTRERIAFLELQPEPAGGRDKSYAPRVQNMYRDVIAGVREVDQDTPFLIGPRDGYNVKLCDEAFLEERTDCAYTGNFIGNHLYGGDGFDNYLKYLTDMREKRGVPVWVQQFGRKSANDPDCSALKYAVQRMREVGIGYTVWQWKCHTVNNTGGYSLNYPDKTGAWVRKDAECAVLQEAWAA